MKTGRVPKSIVRKAEAIAERVEAGEPIANFRGHRLQSDRRRISIPIGRRYRLIVQDTGAGMRAVSVMSHEAYNGTKPGRRR